MKPCNGCGKCCEYGGNGRLGGIDQAQVDLWSTTKPELLSYIQQEADDHYLIWVHPQTGALLETCPWLIEGENGLKFQCAIHDVKPSACLGYPISILQMMRDGCEIWEESDNQNNGLSLDERESQLKSVKNL